MLTRFLKPADLRRLESFEFAPKLLAEGYLAGQHRSHRRGSSIEFREYRQYTPGDDPALVDWRAFARSDRHYVRTYEQETNFDCHLILDASASMGFGAPASKLEFASFFAAALAYLVIRQGDRVSLTLFDEGVRTCIPPGATTRQLHALFHALETAQPGRRTATGEALRRAFPLLKRRGTVIILSDLLEEPASVFHGLNAYLHRGFRVHLVQVLTPAEIALEPRGLTAYVDPETGSRVTAHPADVGAGYRDAMAAHLQAVRRLAARRGVDHTLARTDGDLYGLLDRILR
jgi:uncharacterized protein (DUF58 family)